MNPKRTVWVVIAGSGILVGYRALKTGSDPIPQLAGIGAAGLILLFGAEIAPKLASGLAVLLGISLALNWDNPNLTSPGTGGRKR